MSAYEVSIIGDGREEHVEFSHLESAYRYYRWAKDLPCEVALHDLENNETITDNTYGSDQ